MRISFLLMVAFVNVLFAGTDATGSISWGMLIFSVIGGLALFLYGMEKMSTGMQKAAGDKMRSILAALTSNRIMALIVGAFVTMVIQSSSATTVMLVSFVQAQLMTFVSSIGVILGANIGTTITAQLIAFKLTDFALLIIAVGFFLTFFGKNESQKHLGEAILGFGILFYGMKVMSDAMKPLRTYDPFIAVLRDLENPLLGMLAGAIFTALIQSSSALTGIVIVLSQQGVLSLEAGIPLILGANVGTCITAGLASIGASREAKRVAIAHVVFNITGALIFLFLIPFLADLVRWISPSSTLEGAAKLAADTPRQIANAHSIFNITVGLIFLPLISLLGSLIYRFYPKQKELDGVRPVVWHLDVSSLTTPALAIDLARSEISRMAKILERMLEAVIHPFFNDHEGQDMIYPQLSVVEGIKMREAKLDYLEAKLSDYLKHLGRQSLTDAQIAEVFSMLSIVNDIESIGDVINRNLMPLAEKKNHLKIDFSKEGREELGIYHRKVCKQISRLKKAFSHTTPERIQKIIKKEGKYLDLSTKLRTSHLERFHEEREESVVTHEVHMELLEILKRINVHAAEIAKVIHTNKEQEEDLKEDL